MTRGRSWCEPGDSTDTDWPFSVHLELPDEWSEPRMLEQEIKFTIGP